MTLRLAPAPLRFRRGDQVLHRPTETRWWRLDDDRWLKITETGHGPTDEQVGQALAGGTPIAGWPPADELVFLPHLPARDQPRPGLPQTERDMRALIMRPAEHALVYRARVLPAALRGTHTTDLDQLVQTVPQIRQHLTLAAASGTTVTFHGPTRRLYTWHPDGPDIYVLAR